MGIILMDEIIKSEHMKKIMEIWIIYLNIILVVN
jgi:hypothetical protein